MNKEKYFQEQVDKILPKQKPLDNRNFFQRNRKLLIIIGLILLILYIGANLYVHQNIKTVIEKATSNLCKVAVEDINFKDTTLQDSSSKDKNARRYTGVIVNRGDVNVNLKGIKAKLYDKDNKLLKESYLDYKNIYMALTQKVELNMTLSVEDESQITKYEFIPEYTCSNTGYYIN